MYVIYAFCLFSFVLMIYFVKWYGSFHLDHSCYVCSMKAVCGVTSAIMVKKRHAMPSTEKRINVLLLSHVKKLTSIFFLSWIMQSGQYYSIFNIKDKKMFYELQSSVLTLNGTRLATSPDRWTCIFFSVGEILILNIDWSDVQ